MNSMSCKEVLQQLSEYLDGEVAEELRKTIDSHLLHCRGCKIIFDTTRQTLRLVRDTEPFEVPLEVSARLYARLSAILTGGAN